MKFPLSKPDLVGTVPHPSQCVDRRFLSLDMRARICLTAAAANTRKKARQGGDGF